jgi:hypothetical protein
MQQLANCARAGAENRFALKWHGARGADRASTGCRAYRGQQLWPGAGAALQDEVAPVYDAMQRDPDRAIFRLRSHRCARCPSRQTAKEQQALSLRSSSRPKRGLIFSDFTTALQAKLELHTPAPALIA